MRNSILVSALGVFFAAFPATPDEIRSANYNLVALTGADNGCSGTDCVAVLLIHGIHGTNNDSGCDPSCGLNTPAATDCNWMPLISHLRAQTAVWSKIRVFIFRYKSDVGESTVDIGNALRAMVDQPPADCANCVELRKPFIIVAHSMGGLVARQFMNSQPVSMGRRGADMLSGVITLATPHHGSPLANRVLRDTRVEALANYSCPNPEFCSSPALRFDAADNVYWSLANGSREQATNADLPNRSDLLWDEYDDLFTQQRQTVRDIETNRPLATLAKSLQAAADSRKLIVFGSSVNITDYRASTIDGAIIQRGVGYLCGIWAPFDQQTHQSRHTFLEAAATMSNDSLHSYFSDGMVPLASAIKEGDPLVNLRRDDLNDYDHQDMLGDPADVDKRAPKKNLDLFNRVTADIDSLLRFGVIPPRLLRLDASPDSVAAGTTVALSYRIRNGTGNTVPVKLKAIIGGTGGKSYCDAYPTSVPAPDKTDDVIVSRALTLPSDFPAGPVSVIGEILPAAELNPCTVTLLPGGNPLPSNTTGFNLYVPPAYTKNPAVTLSLVRSDKLDYRIGETAQLKMTTTSGTLAPSPFQTGGVTTLATVFEPPVSLYLWVVRPDGSIRYHYLDSSSNLRESTLPTPVATPAPAVDLPWNLPPIMVDSSMIPGVYNWYAAIYRGESSSAADQLAVSKAVAFRVLAERALDPSVVAISTPIRVYQPGDQMFINYTTRRGSSNAKYDLMLRITSQNSGTSYYFYDDASDTNRWIHTSPRAMQTLIPVDGDAQLPTADTGPIQIANDTPSGSFDMTAYFSLPGQNKQVGESTAWAFVLDTPAPAQCFIATAAYGSPLNSSVIVLRTFRNRVLLASAWGSRFVDAYYTYSPRLAAVISNQPVLRKLVRSALWPVVLLSNIWLISGFGGVLGAMAVALGALLWLLRRYRRITLFALAMILCVGVARAVEIRGSVVRSQPFPAPVAGATVSIVNTSIQTASGPDGTFRFQNLSSGTYQVEASAPGYQSASLQTSVSPSNGIQNVVLALTPTGARSYEYYLPHTAETGGWWTFLALTNPGGTGADVSFQAFDAAGRFIEVSSKLTRIEINQQFSGSPSAFFSSGVGSNAAWYKITSSVPLAGIEMFGQNSGTIAAFQLTTAETNSLYLPHIAAGSQWWTGLSIVSGWVRTANVTLDVRDGAGVVLASASRLGVLRPGQKSVDQLQNYFGWDYPATAQWASIRSDGPVTGFELFGTRDFQMMAAIPATGRGARRLFFNHVATSAGWWTGVAMLNVGTGTATVKLTAYGVDGSTLASSRPLSLSASQRIVDQLPSFFNSWPPSVKYVEVNSDSDLIAFELVGNFDLHSMGGMPAFTSPGAQLAYPFVESDPDGETTIQIVNASGASAHVTLDAFDASGSRLAHVTTTIPAKAVREGTVKTLFGTALSNVRSLRVSGDVSELVGYASLTRLKAQGFTDFPAQFISQNSGMSAFVQTGSSVNLSRLIDAVHFDPDADGGVRVTWPADVDLQVRTLAGGQLRSGDIVAAVEDVPIESALDLWNAYRRNRDKTSARVQVRRGGGQPISIEVHNPVPDARAGSPR